MAAILKILHLEDNPADAELIARFLKKTNSAFTIKVAQNKEKFVEALESDAPDLILSDHSLPQFNSSEALKIYKKFNYQIPFILVTGTVSEEFAIQSIKEGADDYLLKGNLTRLPSAIAQALKSRKIESEKRIANTELELVNKELSTFIYKAAHDLRGPVCSILGLINMANEKASPENTENYILKISQCANKLDSILLSLMDVMSIKNGKPIYKEIDLRKLIDSIRKRITLEEPTIDLNWELNCTVGLVYFDEVILQLALYNIIQNAVKFRDHRNTSPTINIDISQIKNELVIKVTDDGIGIEKDVLDNIFDMYFRGNQHSFGSGLGLYIAKTSIKKLGGTIEVVSEKSIGSVFSIILPIQKIRP
ncbi:ATP-binding response regulator [Aurantibacillus circumpalustris]|uniref:ATP-binding response regulator n=1 Tax=Aurantibacillus circumpalustris TaxID=3036359 RepID=UPI00295A995F|nr:hybrid sensor histidine kinase/response regulator [Aurantibacillus circumpalustris]